MSALLCSNPSLKQLLKSYKDAFFLLKKKRQKKMKREKSHQQSSVGRDMALWKCFYCQEGGRERGLGGNKYSLFFKVKNIISIWKDVKMHYLRDHNGQICAI